MVDRETIKVYDARAGDYAALTDKTEPDTQLKAFMALLPAGAKVLDLGCGPGTASAMMRAAGFDPDPVDASRAMVDLARDKLDLPARVMTFDDLDAVGTYDGIWANFSLLHAPRDHLPRHLAAIATALKPAGIFHIGMKTGTGAQRDGIGRMYTYVTEAELETLLTKAGFTLLATDRGRGKGLDGVMADWAVMRARKD